MGVAETAGGVVILEPEQWVGRKLPIAEFIDVDLTRGVWIAVLQRHDCPACQVVMPQYEQLAVAGHHVALVEVPRYGGFAPHENACHHGRLIDDRNWLVQIPVEIRLQDGVVTAVASHGY